MDKVNTHIVIKREDALKYLTEVEYQTVEQFQHTIIKGRAKDCKRPINSYYVCNTDEPYAEVVKGVIMLGESAKNLAKCKETINNDAYLWRCNCPVCGKSIQRDSEEKTFYCSECGTKLHQRAFTQEELGKASFDREMDSYED